MGPRRPTVPAAIFGAAFVLAAALSLAAGLLVTASVFLAERGAPEGFLGLHPGVSSVFAALGLLLVSIAVQALGLAGAAAALEAGAAAPLHRRLSPLLLLLGLGGLGLSGVLAVIVWGILSRIGEGFAVFG